MSEETLDLTPRESSDRPGRGRTGWLAIGAVIAIVAVLGFVIFKFLSDASLFFLNADEAVEQREDLGDDRFRIQGTPVPGSITETTVEFEQAVAFSISFNGTVVDIVHVGSPPDLFQPGVPVVLEGNWIDGLPVEIDEFGAGANDGYYFASNHMLVKHENDYRTDNEQRLEDAERGGEAPAVDGSE
jgi:cytochrome c-type biogenesis protein CcmE